MGFSELIKCGICGVPNRFGDPNCKICKNPLPRERPEPEPEPVLDEPKPDPPVVAEERPRRPPPQPPRAVQQERRPPPRNEQQERRSPPRNEQQERRSPPRNEQHERRPPARNEQHERRPPPRNEQHERRPPPRNEPERGRPPRGRPEGRPPGRPPAPAPRDRGDDPRRSRPPRPAGPNRGIDRRRVRERRPRPEPKNENSRIVAWLACDPLPPVPLGIKPTLTLGRGESCDLVLPHRGVSKVHGIIKVRGKALFYEDEGSSNGTLLNGLRVPGCPLRPGDVLTLGPYEVEVCSNDEMARRNADDQSRGTKVLELTAGPPGTVLSGNLHEVPLTELFQALEFNRRSGTLTVFAKGFLGTLILAEGRPLTAYCEDQADTEAVCAMLALDSGRFELNNEAADVEPTMDCTLTSLLFEASRRADEGGRGGSAA